DRTLLHVLETLRRRRREAERASSAPRPSATPKAEGEPKGSASRPSDVLAQPTAAETNEAKPPEEPKAARPAASNEAKPPTVLAPSLGDEPRISTNEANPPIRRVLHGPAAILAMLAVLLGGLTAGVGDSRTVMG